MKMQIWTIRRKTTAYNDLLMSEQSGRIPFDDVKDRKTFIDKNLAERVSRADLAKRIKSPALRSFAVNLRKKSGRSKKKSRNKVDSFNLLAQEPELYRKSQRCRN